MWAAPASAFAQDAVAVARIGEVSGAPEYTFGFVSDVQFGPSGEIIVLDRQGAVVRVYDPGGRHLRSFGKPGEGPGEFRLPRSLVVTDSTVTVLDEVLRRFVRFRMDGTHLETVRYPDNYEGRIEISVVDFDGLRTVKRNRATVTPVPLTESDWRQEEARERQKRLLPKRTSLIGPPFAAQLDGCLFDDNGSLWVRRINEADDTHSHWIVIPSDDRQQRVVRVPRGFALRAVRGNLAAGIRRGEYDTQIVEVLRFH